MMTSSVARVSPLRPRTTAPDPCVAFLGLLRAGIPEILAFHEGKRGGEPRIMESRAPPPGPNGRGARSSTTCRGRSSPLQRAQEVQQILNLRRAECFEVADYAVCFRPPTALLLATESEMLILTVARIAVLFDGLQ